MIAEEYKYRLIIAITAVFDSISPLMAAILSFKDSTSSSARRLE